MTAVIDKKGFRSGVGIIVMNDRQELLWLKRIGQEAWQFPQGGMLENESSQAAMFRELHEEVGLSPEDVEIVAVTSGWLKYRLPEKFIRHHSKPLCLGQKQKWYLLKFVGEESHIVFDKTDSPEFDHWKWINYWGPMKGVIDFKRDVYRLALKHFQPYVFPAKHYHYRRRK
ncbi:MAG: RNA pyrophosphohydrolase [Gammaproteobacteria bacterium]